MRSLRDRMNKGFEQREKEIERKEKQLRDFEADLNRRERQLTELILKNERSERGFNTKILQDESLSHIVSPSMLQISHEDVIDFNKSAERCSAKSVNIDALITQFQSHQDEMIRREEELNKFLEGHPTGVKSQESPTSPRLGCGKHAEISSDSP